MKELKNAPTLVLKSTESYPTYAADGITLQEGTTAVKPTASGTEYKIYDLATDTWADL